MRFIRSFSESLGAQLLAALSLIVAVVLTVYAFVGFRTTQLEITELIQSESRRTANLVRRATHDGMLLNQLDEVQQILERMAETREVRALRVFDKQGRIVLSAAPIEIGRQTIITDEACDGCHSSSPATDPLREDLATVNRNGEDVLRHLSVLPNEPACSNAACHAHPADQEILGVLDLEMSLAPAHSSMAGARSRLIMTSLILLALTSMVTWRFIDRLVQQPARRLHEAATRVASGDLDVHVDIEGRHELARLGRAFNSMIGDLAEARRQIEGWSRRLESKVVEKTDELQRSQRQVLHMEKMASLGKLAATVAHELNNPLGGILTYARLTERELEDPDPSDETRREMKRYLEVIQRECSRCGNIIRHLLLFARQGGEEREPVAFTEVLERSIELIRHHLEMYDIELDVETKTSNVRIQGNLGELEQALVALFVNAVEAMVRVNPEGGGRLRVRLLSGANQTLLVEISDTGVGIPAELRQRIFEPFFSTKSDQGGVGLGLSVVYGIVQNHGGSIEVESEPGKGTLFRLCFPLVKFPTEERPTVSGVGA